MIVPFRVSGELVTQYRYSVDSSACLEMLLDLFWRGLVIHLRNRTIGRSDRIHCVKQERTLKPDGMTHTAYKHRPCVDLLLRIGIFSFANRHFARKRL